MYVYKKTQIVWEENTVPTLDKMMHNVFIQIKAIQEYLPMVLFVMLHTVVIINTSVHGSFSVIIQMKPTH